MIKVLRLEEALAEKILVTAALPYANGPLHVGHLAGAYMPADVYVRYQRLKGSDVIFICGSDEHGVPITIRADHEQVAPQAIVDRYHFMMKESFRRLGIQFDNYSRTSLPLHYIMHRHGDDAARDFGRDLRDVRLHIGVFGADIATALLPDHQSDHSRHKRDTNQQQQAQSAGSPADHGIWSWAVGGRSTPSTIGRGTNPMLFGRTRSLAWVRYPA